MFSITSILSLFTLLAISAVVFFVAKRFRIQYTVLLVLVGLLLIPIVELPYLRNVFGFLGEIKLTPELLFYIFLPVLIFESAFNINIRKMLDSAWAISLLAVVGLIVSAFLIAGALYVALPFVGFEIPFVIALLFGAVISSTDPVAVLALFKEYGAPKRLTMIFEGESLLNDGTAVALFLVVLSAATYGFSGVETVFGGVIDIIVMIAAGVVLGLFMAVLFSRALRFTRSNEFVTVTLLLISAHIVFVISELINEHGLFGVSFHVSSIVATTIAALFLGNYSRHTLTPKTDEYLGKLIEHMAFIANSLVFILAGLLFASSGIDVRTLWLPILVTVLVVALMRLVSVYAVTTPLNWLRVENKIPQNWQLLLSWGSLRGALVIIIILLVPEEFTVQGWDHDYSPREFLLALAIGCILATLFIKAPLMGVIMRALRINQPEPLKLAHEADLDVYYLLTEKSRFEMQKTRGFVRDAQYKELRVNIDRNIVQSFAARDELSKQYGTKLFDQSLHLMAIHIESFTLKQLYVNGEISERMYRKITSKLNLQTEKIEFARHDEIDPTAYTDRKDIFDRLVNFMQTVFDRKSSEITVEERLQYYRAQMIMARKAVKTIREMQTKYDQPVFVETSYEKIVAKYEHYKDQCADKVDRLLQDHDAELASYLGYLAKKSLAASGGRALEYLHSRGITDEVTEESMSHRWG